MVISFKVDAFFANYLLGNNGAEMVECLERQVGAKIKVQQDEVVLMDTDDLTKRERIETELVKAWHQDDFERALEVTKIAEMSETFESFTLPVQEAALVERRAKTLARNSGVDAIKVHGTGIVTVFGTQFAVVKARCAISDIIKGENLASTPTTPTQDGEAGKNSAASQDSTGPCTLSFWVPERAARLVIGRGGHNVDEFERIHRCLIEVRTPEKNADGNVPVDITSKNIKSTYDAKDALFRFLDRHIPNRDWPVRVDIRCADPIPRSVDEAVTHNVIETSDGRPTLSSGGVNRLTFMVEVEDAPRLIGKCGLNKRRLEELTKCALSLRTEEKRNGLFPVDVVGRSAADCERAKERILGFLEERPRINPSSPRKPPSQYGSPAKHRPASIASDSGGYDTPPSPTKSTGATNSLLGGDALDQTGFGLIWGNAMTADDSSSRKEGGYDSGCLPALGIRHPVLNESFLEHVAMAAIGGGQEDVF